MEKARADAAKAAKEAILAEKNQTTDGLNR